MGTDKPLKLGNTDDLILCYSDRANGLEEINIYNMDKP
jgi:hypothetical protein